MADHDEVVRLYGPWRQRTPIDVAALLDGYRGPWWIAGGWAIEAFTGVPRPHGDLDAGIPRSDTARLLEHVQGRLDVWAAARGTLRPLPSATGAAVPRTCSNLWLRRSGAEPWEYDVLLTDVADAVWAYKRDPRIRRPLRDILWTLDGIKYLRPEIQLLHKAPGRRPKDEQDLQACLPVLDPRARRWLAAALALAHPGHPWVDRLDRGVR